MRTIKIEIRPEVRAFNKAVERCDFITAYQFDREPAAVLLDRMNQAKCFPASADELRRAMAKLSVSVKR